jgi:ribosomal protein S27AE
VSSIVRLVVAKRYVYSTLGDETMADGEQCPRCAQELVVHGSFSTRGLRFGFRPEELRFFSLSLQFPEVPVTAVAAACPECGLVWAELDAAVLRQKLHDLGNEDVRRRLGLLDGE